MSNLYNKDFYAFLPDYAAKKLEKKIAEYGNEPWFEEAWNKYAKIAASKSMFDIPDPNKFFDEYIEYLFEEMDKDDSPKYQASEPDDDILVGTDDDLESFDEDEEEDDDLSDLDQGISLKDFLESEEE